MRTSTLYTSLNKYGTVQAAKEGLVFTFLITGTKLTSMNTVNDVQQKVLQCVGDKYPVIEVMKNDETFILIVLKKKI